MLPPVCECTKSFHGCDVLVGCSKLHSFLVVLFKEIVHFKDNHNIKNCRECRVKILSEEDYAGCEIMNVITSMK